MQSTEIQALAHAIVAEHAPVFAQALASANDAAGNAPVLTPQSTPAAFSQAPSYLAALQACSTLGFIEVDAYTLAAAWQAQTERLGYFDASHWPDDPRDFGLVRRDADTQAEMQTKPFAPCPQALGLYAVLPTADWVGRMARAGVPTVQLRFKSDDAHAIRQEVQAAVQAVEGTGANLYINDHWRVALAEGAYGIHLGQEDLDALSTEEVAQMRNAGARLGVSTHGYAEMLRAAKVQPSYIALGAVFPTTLKKMATAPQGLARLAAYVRLMQSYPLVAIGGISADLFQPVLATGVGSIAVVRALVNAPDAEGTAQQLLAAMRG